MYHQLSAPLQHGVTLLALAAMVIRSAWRCSAAAAPDLTQDEGMSPMAALREDHALVSWRQTLGLAALLGLAVQPALAQQGRVQRGQAFAQTNCSQCHAVGRVGDSPLALAPPFRDLHKRYPVEDLAEAFAEGITTGHPTMPEFVLDPAQINDLIAYLRSLAPAMQGERRS